MDTKVSTTIKTNESKMAFFSSEDGQCAINFAMSSDDSTFPKSAVIACWEMVRKMDFSTVTLQAIHDTAEFAQADFYRDHI